jgi:hypothetical protein
VFYRFDDGWTVQDLNTKALLVDEGNHQHICVGQEANGYPQRVAAGEIKIYSLRDPEGRPHVTMTWSAKKKLYEAATEHNGKVESDEIRRRCAAFGRSLGTGDIRLVLASLLAANEANLSEANLSGEYLSGANLSGANLSLAYLIKANLSNANLIKANLIKANLSFADLSGADLSGANLIYANLGGAALLHSRYSARTKWPDGFDPVARGAVLTNDED